MGLYISLLCKTEMLIDKALMRWLFEDLHICWINNEFKDVGLSLATWDLAGTVAMYHVLKYQIQGQRLHFFK